MPPENAETPYIPAPAMTAMWKAVVNGNLEHDYENSLLYGLPAHSSKGIADVVAEAHVYADVTRLSSLASGLDVWLGGVGLTDASRGFS